MIHQALSSFVSRGRVCLAACTVAVGLAASVQAADLVKYALCDVRILYVYDEPTTIDWPTLYYLNDQYGCRVDLVRFVQHAQFRLATRGIAEREIYDNVIYLKPGDTAGLMTASDSLFRDRRPDVVLFGRCGESGLCQDFKHHLQQLPKTPSLLFDIQRLYEVVPPDEITIDSAAGVTLNVREMASRYRRRMDAEIPRLFRRYEPEDYSVGSLGRYRLLEDRVSSTATQVDFLSGISTNRLISLIDTLFTAGPMQQTFVRQANGLMADFSEAGRSEQRRAELVVKGYRGLLDLCESAQSAPDDGRTTRYRLYLERFRTRAERATLDATGIGWEGRLFMRDSPHGPRVKFRAALSVDGSQEVQLLSIVFEPFWDSASVPLDTVVRSIAPHQSYVREYLLDIDRSRLEQSPSDSLMVTTSVVYGRIPMQFSETLPLRSAPQLDIRFMPDFFFVPPVANLDIDRVVSSMAWNVVIDKPRDYSGSVHVNLETPRGVFAGAYRTDLSLSQGTTSEIVRIPFSLSNLFEVGLHPVTVTLTADGRAVSADTGSMRIARCEIDDKVSIGFLSDSSGLLEDILRMTDARFRPLTDRGLMTGDLSAYSIIVVGSGAHRCYPSIGLARDRFEEYLRNGGTIIVLGQDYGWPESALPFALAPSIEYVDSSGLINSQSDHRLLSKPYQINTADLFASVGSGTEVAAAVVSPADKIVRTPSGASLLSVSRLGDGRLIYCGLPVLEMVSRLDLEAIHFFANLLNR